MKVVLVVAVTVNLRVVFVPISIVVIGRIEKVVYHDSVTSFVLCLSLSVFGPCLYFISVPISIVVIGGRRWYIVKS